MRSRLVLLTATLVFAAACKDDEATGPRRVDLELRVAPSSLTLAQDSTVTLNAVVRDRVSGLAEPSAPTFDTGDPKVATVTPSGVVFAAGGGTTNITVSYRDAANNRTLTQTIPVTVTANPLATIALAPKTPSVFVGDTVRLTASLRNAAGTSLPNRPRTFSVATPDTAVASVASTGLVTAKRTGTARVIVSADGKADTATVTVSLRPVATVTFGPDPVAVRVGSTVPTTVTLKAANGETLTGRTVTYQSANTGVASVNSSGVITGVAEGVTTITATSEGKTATLTVAVVR